MITRTLKRLMMKNLEVLMELESFLLYRSAYKDACQNVADQLRKDKS